MTSPVDQQPEPRWQEALNKLAAVDRFQIEQIERIREARKRLMEGDTAGALRCLDEVLFGVNP